MDHQLSDELNLDNAMGVDFEHGEDSVVNQADISLQSSDVEGMAMEFEHIEEQAMLMESAGEEIVGTESLIGEEFTLDEGESYVVQDGKVLETNVNYQSNVVRSETMLDLQYEPQTLITTTSTTNTRTQIIPIKAAHRPLAAAPKQIAIAPKPAPVRVSCAPPATRHVAIAPKLGPKTAAAAGPRPMKTMSLSDVLQSQKAGQTVITQLGKQFVMMPAGASGQKIKLVQAGGQQIQAQFVTAKNMATGQVTKKPVMAKVIVTSQGSSQQSAEQPIITGVGMSAAPRFVQVQPRTVAISLDSFANKIMGSPTKHGIRFSKPKQHIVTVQSTSPTKLLPAPAKGVRLPVTADGSKNVVLKAAFPHKVVQAGKADGPRTQIHQINVPGKGVQYIRLVTNPTTSAKAPERTQAGAGAATTKNIVFTDSKGNVIQMAAEKVLSGGQPPPLVVPGGASLSKVTAKPQQKLVRIAPVVTKVSQANTMQFPRSGQSLLAPVSALPAQAVPPAQPAPPPAQPAPVSAQPAPPSPEDSKAALRALIEDAVREDPEAEDTVVETQEMWREDDHDRPQSPHKKVEEDNDDSMDRHETNMDDSTIEEHPLIVIPSNFEQREESNSNDRMEEAFRMSFMNINPDTSAYQQPQSPANEEDLEDRPRKACNCTKSQCLKLYCDCFANGEFCNRCNCTNCHNNLENEELRQKAIRGCLDRNPNAFRPKIGKSRAGGPETIRRHNKGCNCKRSGCLKNYCECYEAKIACTGMCKCVGCRNVEMALERLRRREAPREPAASNNTLFRPPPPALETKQPCSFMTTEVIEAVCQCLLASGAESEAEAAPDPSNGQGIVHVLEEFARCLQDIIGASQQEPAVRLLDGSM